MNPIAILAINAISSLLKLKADKTFSHLQVDVEKLIAQLKPTLPVKADGTAWTDEDVQAAKTAADLPWQVLKAMTGG